MSKDFQDWEASQPGRNVTVGHPDYVAPDAGEAPSQDPHEGMEGLTLDQRRLKLGHGGLSAHEVKIAGRRVA